MQECIFISRMVLDLPFLATLCKREEVGVNTGTVMKIDAKKKILSHIKEDSKEFRKQLKDDVKLKKMVKRLGKSNKSK